MFIIDQSETLTFDIRALNCYYIYIYIGDGQNFMMLHESKTMPKKELDVNTDVNLGIYSDLGAAKNIMRVLMSYIGTGANNIVVLPKDDPAAIKSWHNKMISFFHQKKELYGFVPDIIES